MQDLKLKAVKITQKGRNLYLTSIKCKDLLNEENFKIDEWKEEQKDNINDQGYQRAPSQSHINSVVKYMVSDNIPIFSTNILLNFRERTIPAVKSGDMYDLTIDRPLWIVDGQHRIYGIRKALKEKVEGWEEIPIPAVIMDGFSKHEELDQFKTINETQKGIPTNLIQWQLLMQILRNPDLIKKPAYRKREWEVKALKVMIQLYDRDDSPWKNRIQLPNSEKNPRHSINQTSFITSLKPLFKGGFLSKYTVDDSYLALKNFWLAIIELFPVATTDKEHYLIYKTPGIFPLHSLANEILSRCNRDFGVDNMLKHLKQALPSQKYNDEFWRKSGDGAALYGSMKGFKYLGDEMINNLPEKTLNN